MPINFFQLEELSRKVNLSLEQTELELFHDIFLYSLFNISKLKKYTKHLAFKGGTCLYKCYGFPRFSEDLDFDILSGELSKKHLDLLFNRYLADILGEIFGLGNVKFEIKDHPTGFNVHTNIRGLAFSQTHRDCHLKFDLSSRKRLIYGLKEVKHDASLFFKNYNIGGIINLEIVDPREIFAEKIITILDKKFIFGQRDEARDLFDLYILLSKNNHCKLEDVRNKLPTGKKEVFTHENFSDSIYHTVKPVEWNSIVNQLVIKPKLKELELSLEDIDFNKVSKFVIDKIKSLYFQQK
ncbi:nucleotidyl transferase AbiEii/AbiGii toxin family protein [archaeon]|nr:nucleotidyl transferase AbiEii/AbiGii toxin family protein [archaeon]